MNRWQIEEEERRVRDDHLAARAELAASANPAIWTDIAAQRRALIEAIFAHFLEQGLLPPVWGTDPLWDQAMQRKGEPVIVPVSPAIELQEAA